MTDHENGFVLKQESEVNQLLFCSTKNIDPSRSQLRSKVSAHLYSIVSAIFMIFLLRVNVEVYSEVFKKARGQVKNLKSNIIKV